MQSYRLCDADVFVGREAPFGVKEWLAGLEGSVLASPGHAIAEAVRAAAAPPA